MRARANGNRWALLLAALLLGVGGSARADDTEPPEIEGDPHGGSDTWHTAVPTVQAQQDPNLGPAGKGAIFVPAMTDSQLEPKYLVRQDGHEIARTLTGRKTFVLPGTYRVFVGSGVPENMLEFEVTVVEGRTTFVPVEWGGIVINVTNERGTPIRRSYELVHLPDFSYVGVGLGANIAEGEQLRTWLLHPGRYMLLGEGEGYQARKNFFTLRLEGGELVQYTLVIEEETGDFLGAGEVVLESDTVQTGEGWDVDLVLGGSFQFNRSDNVVGKGSGNTINVSAFLEALVRYNDEDNLAYARFNVEEGGDIRLPGNPYKSTTDLAELDLLYVYKVVPWFGPYVRSSVETNFIRGLEELAAPATVARYDTDGTLLGIQQNVTNLELAGSLSPIELQYGAGGRVTFSPDYWFDMTSRLGVGGRQVFTRDLFVEADDPSTPELELKRKPDITQVGFEWALVANVYITRYVSLNLEADILEPFDAFDEPVIDLRSTVALRIASFAAVNYVLRLKDDPALSPDTQIDQTVQLRFAWKAL